MTATEITQAQYEKLTGANPSLNNSCPTCPVERVNWTEARDFCKAAGGRLPTEAEWEYAARSGGKEQKWSGTASEGELGEYAWYRVNSGNAPHPVGQKRPNALGLHDMSGNVWEWVGDYFERNYYRRSPRDNPQGAELYRTLKDAGGRPKRVYRGGAFNEQPYGVSVHLRRARAVRSGYLGFRCAMSETSE
jgi:formylglycine-generating enzyme required for sulfatase activity